MFSRLPDKKPRPSADSARRTVAAAQAKAKDGVRAAPSKVSLEKAVPKSLAGDEEALHLSEISGVRGVDGVKPFSLLHTPEKASTPGGAAPSQTEDSTACAAGAAEGGASETLALPSLSSGGSADKSAKAGEGSDTGPVQRDDGVWVVTDRPKVVRTEVPSPVLPPCPAFSACPFPRRAHLKPSHGPCAQEDTMRSQMISDHDSMMAGFQAPSPLPPGAFCGCLYRKPDPSSRAIPHATAPCRSPPSRRTR
ncbi:hypothetical protein T484DRAFT_1747704 [Baffinella frigidus]|nr:hypothetical protein T484DRAFT_1747704 [Cryptophyta sp. CCMP2293]